MEKKRMNYFGFNISNGVLLGDTDWFKRLKLGKPNDFNPYEGDFLSLLQLPNQVINQSTLKAKMNPCIHLNRDFYTLINNLELINEFNAANSIFQKKHNEKVKIVEHANVLNGNLPLDGKFAEVFTKEMEICHNLGIKYLVIHPPGGLENKAKDFIQLLTSRRIIDRIEGNDVTICIENLTNDDNFGSLAYLLGFMATLRLRLNNINKGFLGEKIKFCFDSGHLLLWRYYHPNGVEEADKEINEYLPRYLYFSAVYHIKSCGSRKPYFTPYCGPKNELTIEHSNLVMDWLKMGIKNIQSIKNQTKNNRFWTMELSQKSFDLNEITEFASKFAGLF
jgi:xylose isomerase-like TIM barrel protein